MNKAKLNPVSIAELQATADRWLPRLGLSHWLVLVADGELDTEDAMMEVRRHDNAHRATINVAQWLLKGEEYEGSMEPITPEYVERGIVHELGHLLFRDVRYVTMDVVKDELAGPTKATLNIALDHHEEQAVDLLARGLVATWPKGTDASA